MSNTALTRIFIASLAASAFALGACSKAEDAASKAKDAAADAAGEVSDAAKSAADGAKDMASDAADKAGDMAGDMADKAGDMADKAAGMAGAIFSPLVDPNTATEAELKAVGASDLAAEIIVNTRPFANARAMDKMLSDNGVAEAARIGLYKNAFIPFDINTTPEADFMLIPGVGKKMAHEFEEYRPYKDYAQFEREIGKYVDAREVARLKRYVKIP